LFSCYVGHRNVTDEQTDVEYHVRSVIASRDENGACCFMANYYW